MELQVGILLAEQIEFRLQGNFTFNGRLFTGEQKVHFSQGALLFDGTPYDKLLFEPTDEDACSFTLHQVVIGIGFHWERREDQTFLGKLCFVVNQDKVQVINKIDIEQYLCSVISSEMSATSSLELLKAHAVVSRSWVTAPLLNPATTPIPCTDPAQVWYERDAHTLFDVCADDHCQRYQGITRATTAVVQQAVEATRGQILCYNHRVCDARFSKCCGGIAETFENCWAPVEHPYLVAFDDIPQGGVHHKPMTEQEAQHFILHSDDRCFCNTSDAEVLKQVLNNYDQETPDFYRWQVSYSPEQLSELVARKSGLDFGLITALEPLQRGISGRITRLRIVGNRLTKEVGKELEIRRLLSESHLYSSAFFVERDQIGNFILRGAGWGHGVGLCQIGAAVMAQRGYNYRDILAHYYRGATLEERL